MDEAGGIRGEVGDGRSDLVRGTGAAGRTDSGQRLEFLFHSSGALGACRAGLTALTRTPHGPYTAAQALVSKVRACPAVWPTGGRQSLTGGLTNPLPDLLSTGRQGWGPRD
ncbi:hypothetical protein [Streptomyces sp. S.PB5]|uniref:hypothetical protein n=1 Tax=Streptomyces sp. S.PB5 TaxID=3020844 RepID=UPI0025AFA1FA|nr:hypothetical protein [Streptomyces sp. S.PB5]MDN3028037.1 hypothetical protein [Streptomyces sp. S.PB5]